MKVYNVNDIKTYIGDDSKTKTMANLWGENLAQFNLTRILNLTRSGNIIHNEDVRSLQFDDVARRVINQRLKIF